MHLHESIVFFFLMVGLFLLKDGFGFKSVKCVPHVQREAKKRLKGKRKAQQDNRRHQGNARHYTKHE